MRLLKKECLLVALAAVILAAGCGQNPHVTSADEAAAANSGSNASAASDPAAQGADQNGTPTGGNPTDPAANSGIGGVEGATGPTGADGVNAGTGGGENSTIIKETHTETHVTTTTEPVTYVIILKEEAPAPVPVQPTVINGCWKQENTTTDFRGLNPDELQKHIDSKGAELPYLTSSPKNTTFKTKQATLEILSLGKGNQGTAANPYVKNAMVLIETEIYLPPRDAIVADAAFDVTLNLNLYKRDVEVSNAYDDTEILCFLDVQKCSGTLFHNDGGFGNLINPAFGKGSPVVNETYSKQMQTAIQNQHTKVGGRREWTGTLTFKLSDLFTPIGKSMNKQALINGLYGLPELSSGARKLRLVLADDSLVRSASVQLNYTVDSCKAAQK